MFSTVLRRSAALASILCACAAPGALHAQGKSGVMSVNACSIAPAAELQAALAAKGTSAQASRAAAAKRASRARKNTRSR